MSLTPLNEDLNIIQSLVIPSIEDDLDIIQKLDDEPNDVGGLTAAELKAKFDEAGNTIKSYINNTLVPQLSDTVAEAEERARAEAERIANEEARVEAELAREEAEKARVAAEEIRVATENERISAEEERKAAEVSRVLEEQARVDRDTGIVAQATEQADLAANSEKAAAQSVLDAQAEVQNAKDEVENAKTEVQNAQGKVEDAEAWARGTRNGEAVPDTDPAYQNNSKYWAENAKEIVGPTVTPTELAAVVQELNASIDDTNTKVSTLESGLSSTKQDLSTTNTNIDNLSSRVQPVDLGGTGATTAAQARTNLGIGASTTSIPSDLATSLGLPTTATVADALAMLLSNINTVDGEAARIEVGSYVGTGTFGADNPCSITASFPIKALLMIGYISSKGYFYQFGPNNYSSFVMTAETLTTSHQIGFGMYSGTSSYTHTNNSYGKKSADGKTFSWYAAYNAASNQVNSEGATYIYGIIG